MSENVNKLQRLLEQATAAEGASGTDLDPEAASLREAWLDFGRLLEAAQPAACELPLLLGDGQQTHSSPLPLGERQGVRAMPRRASARRWLFSAAALVAASLLIGILTTWMPQTMDRPESPAPATQQTTAINPPDAVLVQQKHQATKSGSESKWDDSLDEQLAQVGQQVAYAQQHAYGGSDTYELLRYGIEQMQQELTGSGL
jgi:hypothetical protein